MSKYFEATLKARNAARPEEILEATLRADSEDAAVANLSVEKPQGEASAPIVQAEPRKIAAVSPVRVVPEVECENPLAESRLAQCRKFSPPLRNIAHVQFTSKDSVEPAEESYRVLRTRLLRMRSAKGLRSIVITSAVQGEGKTLTSLNLALCCAQLHEMRILLVDADIRSFGLSQALDAPRGLGLANILAGECTPEQAVLATDNPNLYVLSSGSCGTSAAELFATRRWPEFVGWCNETFKLTLMDSPPVLHLSDVELITASCDGALMVVRAQQTKRQTLEKCAGQLDSKKLLGIVYNGTTIGTQYAYGYRSYGSGNPE
jgi:capsular exopolysaccharide synthesis family protein